MLPDYETREIHEIKCICISKCFFWLIWGGFDFIWIAGALATLRVSFDWFDEDLIQYEIRCIHISYCFIWLTWGGFVSRWNICAFASPIVFIWLIWGRFDFIWNIGAYPLPTISFDLLEEDLVYMKYRSICISYCFIWLIWGGFVSMWNIVADWLEKELVLLEGSRKSLQLGCSVILDDIHWPLHYLLLLWL